ncbi:unnamed protein product, partial [Adineta steineri]
VVVFIAALYVSQCSAVRRPSAIDRLNYLMKKGSSEACASDCLNTAFNNYKDAVDRCNAPPAASCIAAGEACTASDKCCTTACRYTSSSAASGDVWGETGIYPCEAGRDDCSCQ